MLLGCVRWSRIFTDIIINVNASLRKGFIRQTSESHCCSTVAVCPTSPHRCRVSLLASHSSSHLLIFPTIVHIPSIVFLFPSISPSLTKRGAWKWKVGCTVPIYMTYLPTHSHKLSHVISSLVNLFHLVRLAFKCTEIIHANLNHAIRLACLHTLR